MPNSTKAQPDLLDLIVARWGGTIDYPYVRGADIKGQLTDVYLNGSDGVMVASTDGPITANQLALYIAIEIGAEPPPLAKAAAVPHASNDNAPAPIDIWEAVAKPPLPEGLLPTAIADFAAIQSDLMGCDPAGLAMAALVTCAAAIPDSILIAPKEFDPHWTDSARIWVALVGLPSTMKSPIIATATRPLKAIDGDLYRKYAAEKAAFDALPKEMRAGKSAPTHSRLRIEDTTIEAAQEVLKDSPNGVLMIQDELTGWFGSMDRYNGSSRGASKDRSFWLQTFNGGEYVVNRVGRGATHISNISVSLIGGIQPEPIRAIARDMQDDGLLQRLFPIVLRARRVGKDVPMPDVVSDYKQLVERLHAMKQPMRGSLQTVPCSFSSAAQVVRRRVEERQNLLTGSWETVNVKVSSHIGKYDGLFARLCLLWHCIETKGERPPSQINEDVALRVERFLFDFLYRHAVAFYSDILGVSDKQSAVLATAGHILAHQKHMITLRDFKRGDAVMKGLSVEDAEAVMNQLDSFGWVTPVQSVRRDSRAWQVDGRVFDLFHDRAEAERERREEVRAVIRDALKVA